MIATLIELLMNDGGAVAAAILGVAMFVCWGVVLAGSI
jgi:hypothetical protein